MTDNFTLQTKERLNKGKVEYACCPKTGMILLADGGVPGIMGVFVDQNVGVSVTSTYP